MTRWIRNRPERVHDVAAGLAAGVAGIVVGAGVFWLARLLAAREPLPEGEGRDADLAARERSAGTVGDEGPAPGRRRGVEGS